MEHQTHQVFYLFYQSQLSTGDSNVSQMLKSIAKQAIRLNKKQQLTGVLGYYREENFQTTYLVQYIEGPYDVVQRTFEKIRMDARHQQVKVLFEGSRSQPLFPAWRMKLVDLQNYSTFNKKSRFRKMKIYPISAKFFQFASQGIPYLPQIVLNRQPHTDKINHQIRHKSRLASNSLQTQALQATSNISLTDWNESKFQEFLNNLKQDYEKDQTPSTSFVEYDEDGELPTWVQNRKLLVRVFVIWLILVGYLLFSVLGNI